MAKSLHKYTIIDELVAEVRRCTDQVPSNTTQPDRFWPDLMREISAWDDVEEFDSEDPPTIL